jgi:hypothetical protein
MKIVESLTIPNQCLHLKLSNELRGSKGNLRALEFSLTLGGKTDYSSLIQWYKKDIIRLQSEIDKLLAK